uniref:Putative lipocal-1 1 n=1 Tax=Amblyomma triste TaxID=251400 RepID=A0A023G7V1_AMBTT
MVSPEFKYYNVSRKQYVSPLFDLISNEKIPLILLVAFLAPVFFLPCAATESTTPIWANETRLGKYQDAWNILNQTDVYYLVKSTFNTADYLWGQNFTCVNVRHTYLDQKMVVSNFSFQNASSNGKRFSLDLRTMPLCTYNYTQQNAIQYELHNCSLLNDTVIFTDGESCNLFSIPYENGGMGCELWVREEYLRNGTTPKCCYFLFDLLCAEKGSYEISNKDCDSVQNSVTEIS